MEKYIESIGDIKLGRRIGGGSCSDIFYMGPSILFKRFNEDYSDLLDPLNVEFLETIKTISGIDYLPYVVRAKDIYRSCSMLFGYSMDEVKALELDDISDDVSVFDLMDGFERLKSSIRSLSDNFVKTEDIGGDNILYNGDIYLLDLDLSLVDRRYIPDELYFETRRKVFGNLFKRITGCYFKGEVGDDDYLFYMTKLIDICSNEADFDVRTISDMKSVCPKILKKTTID